MLQYKLLEEPQIEPVTLAELKTMLRIDHDHEDALIAAYGMSARVQVEHITDRRLITQRWRLCRTPVPPDGNFDLPLCPVQSVDQLMIANPDAPQRPVATSEYSLDLLDPASLILSPALVAGRQTDRICADLTLGYGDAAAQAPAPLRQAILILAASRFEQRAALWHGNDASPLPASVQQLLQPYQRAKIG